MMHKPRKGVHSLFNISSYTKNRFLLNFYQIECVMFKK